MRWALLLPFLLTCMACGKSSSTSTGPGAGGCEGVLCPADSGQLSCVDLQTDEDHCGACRQVCSGGSTCQAGSCSASCPGNDVRCGGRCVDLDRSADHCGACGVECAEGQTCDEGRCVLPEDIEGCTSQGCACDGDGTICADDCVDVTTDVRNCGRCGRRCSAGQVCVEGSCECPGGTLSCWSSCMDTSEDVVNCGACGELCPNSTDCQEGDCVCPSGTRLCDGTCVDATLSRFHCGACNVECSLDEVCVGGVCLPSATACDVPAGGVDIARLAIYQGVEIGLTDGAAPIAPAERNADVVQQRDALVRVFVTTHDDYEPRDLTARITLTSGTEQRRYVAQLSPKGDSRQDELSTTFNIFVPKDAVFSDTRYVVELLDCGETPAGSVGTVVAPSTPDGAPLAARATGTVHVVFVPIVHDGREPDASEEILEVYAREAERQFPIVDLTYELARDPIVSSETGIVPDLGLILDQVTERRADDAAPEDVYYYGLVQPAGTLAEYCDGGCTTGIGWWLEGTDTWAIAHRSSVGIVFGTYGANTFAHELGHNLGRDHAPCNATGDDDYPYPNATIGSWGHDPIGGVLKGPYAFADLMSYCEPNWISDYTYQGILERLAASGVEQSERGASEKWASMIVTPTAARWSRTRENPGAPTRKPERGIVYDEAGQPLLQVQVHRMTMADGGGYKLFVPPAQPGWHAVGLPGKRALPYPR